jgi:putative methionine-R-sulfoxide reductase with GAF domain
MARGSAGAGRKPKGAPTRTVTTKGKGKVKKTLGRTKTKHEATTSKDKTKGKAKVARRAVTLKVKAVGGKVRGPHADTSKKSSARKMVAKALPPPYDLLLAKVRTVIAAQGGCEAKMLEICWLFNNRLPNYDWVGFYLASGEGDLALGPFVGEPTEHLHIQVGRGICGQAAERKATFVVNDVAKDGNYLACSPRVRSEIVVPLLKDGKVVAELDIDSHAVARFSATDRQFLETVCALLAPLF